MSCGNSFLSFSNVHSLVQPPWPNSASLIVCFQSDSTQNVRTTLLVHQNCHPLRNNNDFGRNPRSTDEISTSLVPFRFSGTLQARVTGSASLQGHVCCALVILYGGPVPFRHSLSLCIAE